MYVRFLGEQNVYECLVTPISDNVVKLTFENATVVNTNGFHVFLDADCMYDIGGNSYENFKTVYRDNEDSYELSNDGSVYVEPSEPTIEVPSQEEVAIREIDVRILDLNSQIVSLKSQLQSTDYIIIKAYESTLVGEVLTEYDFEEIHSQRQEIRNNINLLETQLGALVAEREVM